MSPMLIVVDENLAVVNLVTQMLAQAGHDVLGCFDLTEAEALIQARRPDAVLLELRRRNEYTGWSLLCRLRQNEMTSGTPVLVTSGDVALLHRYEPELRAFGVSMLTKPFTVDTLVARLATIVQSVEPRADDYGPESVMMAESWSQSAPTN